MWRGRRRFRRRLGGIGTIPLSAGPSLAPNLGYSPSPWTTKTRKMNEGQSCRSRHTFVSSAFYFTFCMLRLTEVGVCPACTLCGDALVARSVQLILAYNRLT